MAGRSSAYAGNLAATGTPPHRRLNYSLPFSEVLIQDHVDEHACPLVTGVIAGGCGTESETRCWVWMLENVYKIVLDVFEFENKELPLLFFRSIPAGVDYGEFSVPVRQTDPQELFGQRIIRVHPQIGSSGPAPQGLD